MKKPINNYETGDGIIPDGMIKLSPSRFERFFSKPHEWFRELIMQEGGFDGNSGSNIGNIIHATAEAEATGQTLTDDEIQEFIDSLPELVDEKHPWMNLEHHVIRAAYPDMQELIREFVRENLPTSTEGYIWRQITPRIVVAGSYDAYRVNPMTGNYIVTDYKTTGEKLPPKSMSYSHKLQLYMYAWMLRKQGIMVDAIEIVYITRFHSGAPAKISEKTGKLGKPGRDYPATLTPIMYEFTDRDMTFISDLIKLGAESLEYFIDHPEAAYIIFRDYRLKGTDFSRYLTDIVDGGVYDDF